VKREKNRLSPVAIRNANTPSLYNDGFGLNLQVSQFWSVEYKDDEGKTRGRSFEKEDLALAHQMELRSRGIEPKIKPYVTKSWLFRFMRNGKDRKMGLGPFETTSLAKARELAQKKRDLLRQGIDPIAQAEAERAANKVEAAKQMTFKQCAEAYIKAHESGWKNAKHAAQWHAAFEETRRGSRVYPAATALLNDLPVAAIDTALVVRALEKIWYTTPESASRIRGRIENVLAWATVRGLRSGDNPARWEGHLKTLLPAKGAIARVEHHAAIPYREMPAFTAELRARSGISARALEFCLLTSTRTGEVIGAKWSEIDLGTKVWTVPAERMKAGREHLVPLSERAVAILAEQPQSGEFVFEGRKAGAPLSNMAMLELMRDMRGKGATVHGFRSTFRDWAGNETNFPRELAEHALAHVIGDQAEQAYRREAAVERRRKLMAAWAAYCEQPPAKRDSTVTPIRERVA
jgi:integrase